MGVGLSGAGSPGSSLVGGTGGVETQGLGTRQRRVTGTVVRGLNPASTGLNSYRVSGSEYGFFNEAGHLHGQGVRRQDPGYSECGEFRDGQLVLGIITFSNEKQVRVAPNDKGRTEHWFVQPDGQLDRESSCFNPVDPAVLARILAWEQPHEISG